MIDTRGVLFNVSYVLYTIESNAAHAQRIAKPKNSILCHEALAKTVKLMSAFDKKIGQLLAGIWGGAEISVQRDAAHDGGDKEEHGD